MYYPVRSNHWFSRRFWLSIVALIPAIQDLLGLPLCLFLMDSTLTYFMSMYLCIVEILRENKISKCHKIFNISHRPCGKESTEVWKTQKMGNKGKNLTQERDV